MAIGLISILGCTSIQASPDEIDSGINTSPTTTPAVETTEPGDDLDQPTATPGAEIELPTGEVPPSLFSAVLEDVLAVSGGGRADVEVVKAEAITWNDGALGCPQPDVMYTQALVPGYQVIFGIGGKTFDYHLADSGFFVLCENDLPSFVPGGTPTQ